MKNGLKGWLKKKGMTVDKFAKNTAIHYSTVCKWMRGSEPRQDMKDRIARAFPDCPLAN